MIAIQKIELPVPGMECLQLEAKAERYDFIETLVEQWASSENRFDAPGEILCGEQGHWPSTRDHSRRESSHPLPLCTSAR